MRDMIIGNIQTLLSNCGVEYSAAEFINKMLAVGIGFGIGIGLIFYNYSFETSVVLFLITFIVFEIFVYSMLLITKNRKVAIVEEVLPDFLAVMAGNIRSGLTHDRALLLSARKEFGPLSKQVDIAAKELIAGKSLQESLIGMTSRVDSEMFSKTMRLIVQGLNSGGNLGGMLESASSDIRKFAAIRKDVSASVLVYQLFIFGAIAVGAPLLYAVANFLITILANIRENVISKVGPETGSYMPFFNQVNTITPGVVFMFSIAALFATVIFGSLAAGVISKGNESDGLIYTPVLLACSFGVFFTVGLVLNALLGGLFLI